MSALWKVLGFTLVAGITAAGCTVTSDDDDDIGGFAGEGGDGTSDGGTTSGGRSGGSGGTTSGGSGGDETGGAGGAAGAPPSECEDLTDVAICCGCADTYCGIEYSNCANNPQCLEEFDAFQSCMAEASAAAEAAGSDFFVEDAEVMCDAEAARTPGEVNMLGLTLDFVACLKGPEGAAGDCRVPCLFETP